MSCHFRKEPLFMSSRRMMMVGMRELWTEWLGSFPGITWSPSCIILSKSLWPGCFPPSQNSQVFPEEKALGIPLEWNEWRANDKNYLVSFVYPPVLNKSKQNKQTKKSKLNLKKWILLPSPVLCWAVWIEIKGPSSDMPELSQHNYVKSIRLRQIWKNIWDTFSGILCILRISPPCRLCTSLYILQCLC